MDSQVLGTILLAIHENSMGGGDSRLSLPVANLDHELL